MGRLHRSATRVLLFIISLVIIIAAWGAFGSLTTQPQTPTIKNPFIPTIPTFAGTPRDPITISSDAGFTGANGVIRGSGIANDPFIIGGWDIDAGGGDHCIKVAGTTKYFIIQDCVLTNFGPSGTGSGLILYSLDNATVQNCSISKCSCGIELTFVHAQNVTVTGNFVCVPQGTNGSPTYGVYLSSSQNVTVSGNIITVTQATGISQTSGLYLLDSSNMTVTGNTITLEPGMSEAITRGLYVSSSSNSTITGNTITGSGTGISLHNSHRVVIEENNCSMDESFAVFSVFSSQNATIQWNNCSIATSPTQREDLCSIISLWSSNYAEILGNNLEGGDVGIHMWNCSHVNSRNNECGLKLWGINLECCASCEVTGNVVTYYSGIMYLHAACVRDVDGVDNIIAPNSCTTISGPLNAWGYLFLGACVVGPVSAIYIGKRKKAPPSGAFDGPWKRDLLVAGAEVAVVCMVPLSVNFPLSSTGEVNSAVLGLFYQSFYPGTFIDQLPDLSILAAILIGTFPVLLVLNWMTLRKARKIACNHQTNDLWARNFKGVVASIQARSSWALTGVILCSGIYLIIFALYNVSHPSLGVGLPLFLFILLPLWALRRRFSMQAVQGFENAYRPIQNQQDISPLPVPAKKIRSIVMNQQDKSHEEAEQFTAKAVKFSKAVEMPQRLSREYLKFRRRVGFIKNLIGWTLTSGLIFGIIMGLMLNLLTLQDDLYLPQIYGGVLAFVCFYVVPTLTCIGLHRWWVGKYCRSYQWDLTGDALHIQEGVFTRTDTRIPLALINGAGVTQGHWEWKNGWFNVTIAIGGMARDGNSSRLRIAARILGVRDPSVIQELIVNAVRTFNKRAGYQKIPTVPDEK